MEYQTLGIVKHEISRRDDLRAEAMDILEKAGAVEECDLHPGTYEDKEDPDRLSMAYGIGTNRFKAGESLARTREELMEAIASAYADTGGSCYNCEKMREED